MAGEYRADHIGSLLRTEQMLEARRQYNAGEISWEQLQEVADREALKAIETQQASGISVFTDGEYRRSWWAGAMFDSLEGLIPNPDPAAAPIPAANRWQGEGNSGELAQETLIEVVGGSHVVGQKLNKVRSLVEQEAAFLKQHAPGPWKITFAAVSNRAMGWFKPGITDEFYPTPNDLMRELVSFLNGEIHSIIGMGCSYVQLDSLRYTQWMNDRGREMLQSQGLDLDAELDEQIAWDNASIEGARGTPGVTVGHHICRGNNRSAWAGEGAYDAVAEKLFTTLNVDRFLLEYDDERSGGFEPLRFVPDDKMVVLGIVSSKLAAPEDKDTLRRRIEEASKYIPVERLAISPQCGFASTMPGNLLTWDEQQRKLELVAEVAEEVWGR
jgi:5-methyltetrahydropteroyltriglutamate--homocysteine methyltransferase